MPPQPACSMGAAAQLRVQAGQAQPCLYLEHGGAPPQHLQTRLCPCESLQPSSPLCVQVQESLQGTPGCLLQGELREHRFQEAKQQVEPAEACFFPFAWGAETWGLWLTPGWAGRGCGTAHEAQAGFPGLLPRVRVSGSKDQGAAGLMVLSLLLFQKTKRQSHTEEAIE